MAKATHNIFAYRFTDSSTGICFHDNDDDGETAAGSRLAEILRLMGANGVAVVVTRWYGGTLLGPDRFRHINNCARRVLETHTPDLLQLDVTGASKTTVKKTTRGESIGGASKSKPRKR